MIACAFHCKFASYLQGNLSNVPTPHAVVNPKIVYEDTK